LTVSQFVWLPLDPLVAVVLPSIPKKVWSIEVRVREPVRQIEVDLPDHFAAGLLLEHHPKTLEVRTLSPLLTVA
jgi:hypothetical protein